MVARTILPKDFGIDDLRVLRVVTAAASGASSPSKLFPAADAKKRKSYSAFIHDKTDLDFRRGCQEVGDVYDAVLRRLGAPDMKHLSKALAPQIAKLTRKSSVRSLSEVAKMAHDIFNCSPAAMLDDHVQLPGAYAVYRIASAHDGSASIMRDALHIELRALEDNKYLTFEMAYGTCDLQPHEAQPVAHLISGVLLPRQRNLHFVGRDESIDAPFQITADRPVRKVRMFTGLATRTDTNGSAHASRILFVRRENMGDPSERVYRTLCKEIGPLPLDAALPDELARVRWTIENGEASVVLQQADLTRWPVSRDQRATLPLRQPASAELCR